MKELFKIYKVDENEATAIQQKNIQPHIHDYEELIIGMKGAADHFIDFENTRLETPFVSFVTQGKAHRVTPLIINNQCEMWAIRFRREFIAETVFRLYSFFNDHANLAFCTTQNFAHLTQICQIIHEEYSQEHPDWTVIQQLLSTLFTLIESQYKRSNPDYNKQTHSKNSTFKNFLQILEENYSRPVGVDFYAEKLFMTSRNLNNICQDIIHQSVSELIETRKLTEAKNLLITTDKTISEIGFDLGFNEKSYFSSVFKRKTGQTPGEFRKEMRKLIS